MTGAPESPSSEWGWTWGEEALVDDPGADLSGGGRRGPGLADIEPAEREYGGAPGEQPGGQQDRVVRGADPAGDLAVADRPVQQRGVPGGGEPGHDRCQRADQVGRGGERGPGADGGAAPPGHGARRHGHDAEVDGHQERGG